ncbi:MAG TPA: RNA polymerase sigma factor [Planctomycetota bacterium]
MHGLERELHLHASALRALAVRLVGPSHADDLVQETSLLAWVQRPDERGGLGRWLRAVLRHRAGKLQRGEVRRARREQHAANEREVASPPDVASQREAMASLHAALMALPAPYQGVLLQRFFQDLTPTTIAAGNGAPLATVKSQLQRGLALLRERLDAGGRGGDWRAAFVGAFGLPRATASVVAMSAGVMLMSTKVFWVVGGAAALLCLVLWPDASPPAPVTVAAVDHAAVAAAARLDAGTGEPLRRHEVVATAPQPPAAAPLRIRLVDAFDRATLPACPVHFERRSSPGIFTMIASDARGELTIDGAWRDQAVNVIAIDDARVQCEQTMHTIAANEWPVDDRCLDVPLVVGPTYRLVFDTALPDGDLFAELIAGGNPVEAKGYYRQPVRPGAMPWVRFAAKNANPSALGDGPWTLVVRGRSWIATGAVQQVRGAQADAVQLRGCPCGVLQIEVTIDSGPPGDAGPAPHASIYPLDKDGKPQEEGGRYLTAQERQIELRVGKYRVFVAGPDRQLHREDVVIEAAATTTVRADFRAGAPKLTLQVVLRSQSGTRHVVASPQAWRVGGSEFDFVNATWKERRDDGAQLYELKGLVPGEWDVALDPTPHLPPWDATTKRVSADAGTVEFVCLDAGASPPGQGWIRVIDGATKQPIERAGVTTVFDQGWHCMAETGAGGIGHLGPCLAGSPVRVLVRAAGYAPAWFEVTPVAETAGAPPLEVALRAGWGTLLMVVGPARRGRGEPLPGVRVLVDGVLAGTTDARGLLLLSSASRPARIELHHDEYVLAYGSIDAATGAPSGEARHPFWVVMEKKAK